MKYSDFSSVVLKEILFCPCKERWRCEVANIKTFPHSSGKAEKPRSGNGARSAREGKGFVLSWQGEGWRCCTLWGFSSLPGLRPTGHIQPSCTSWWKLYPFCVSFNPPSFTSVYIDLNVCISYISGGWKMLQAEAPCKSQQFIFLFFFTRRTQEVSWSLISSNEL